MPARHRSVMPWSSLFLFFLATTDARAQFDYVNGWDGQLFPSYLIATATMRPDASEAAPNSAENQGQENSDKESTATEDQEQGEGEEQQDGAPEDADETDDEETTLGDADSKCLLGIYVTADEDNTPIAVEIEAPGFIEASPWSGVLEKANTEYKIFPALKLNFKALLANTQTVPIAVTYRMWLGDDDAVEHTINMTLRSINDCPTVIAYDKEGVEDISYMFAAYVNEQHPFVDKILRESLDKGVVEAFDGYQSGNAENVIRQVYAIWDALSHRDVRYSSITASAAVNKMVASQHVRFIDQSINNAQANCVDGSALMASLLRKIEIETALVLVPGHCYLAFALDPEGKQWMGMETTLIGKKNVDVPPDVENDKIVDPKFQRTNSWLTFRLALDIGNKNLKEHMPKFEKKDSLDSLAYRLISVSHARHMGILPIAFNSSERLNSLDRKP